MANTRQHPEGCDSIKKAEAFLAYCRRNPTQRFWQALTNWCGLPFLGWAQSTEGECFHDLWHERELPVLEGQSHE